MEWMRLTWKRVGSIKVCRNFTTRVSHLTLALSHTKQHTHSHTHTRSRSHQSRASRASRPLKAQPGQEGQGPIRLAREGATGNSGKYWVGLASRDNFGAMFQVPEDKAHLRRESNSRHVSESGPHAPCPCTCMDPATSLRYRVGLTVYKLPYRVHGSTHYTPPPQPLYNTVL